MFQTLVAYFILLVIATTQPIFMLRVWLSDKCGMDDMDTQGGANIGGDVATSGGKLVGRDDRNRGDTFVGMGGGENPSLWLEINRHSAILITHADRINDLMDRWREVSLKLDNTPEKLEVQTDRITQQNSRIQNLENRALEVVVRPGKQEPEVIIRPVTNPDALTSQQLGIYMLIGFSIVVAAVLYLVYLQAAR